MINLTPHPISLDHANGQRVTIQPSGVVARVETHEQYCGEVNNFPVVARQFGEVVGLPENGEPCLVSSMVLSACKGREGVYAPDTGPTAVRDEQGRVVAVTRLVKA